MDYYVGAVSGINGYSFISSWEKLKLQSIRATLLLICTLASFTPLFLEGQSIISAHFWLHSCYASFCKYSAFYVRIQNLEADLELLFGKELLFKGQLYPDL